MPLLLTVDQVCEETNLGRTNVFKLLRRGKIRSVRVGARRLVPRTALEDFVRRLEAEAERYAPEKTGS